jgi:hypothetical protein
MDTFVIHSCEQVLRFAQAGTWDELTEERKVQLAFNMGVMAHGLHLTKEEGYLPLVHLREGTMSTKDFRAHAAHLVEMHAVPVSEENCTKGF